MSSPGGAARAVVPERFCAAFQVSSTSIVLTPGSRPGLFSAGPSDLDLHRRASRRKLAGFMPGRLALITAMAWFALVALSSPALGQRGGQAGRGSSARGGRAAEGNRAHAQRQVPGSHSSLSGCARTGRRRLRPQLQSGALLRRHRAIPAGHCIAERGAVERPQQCQCRKPADPVAAGQRAAGGGFRRFRDGRRAWRRKTRSFISTSSSRAWITATLTWASRSQSWG